MSARPALARAGSSIAVANKTIVLVTGGNSGIGYEIVKSLSQLRSDYQILLGCRNVAKGEHAAASMGAPLNVNPIQLDLNDDRSIEHCYRAIEQHFGRLDILINNASSAGNDLIDDGHDPSPRELWQHVYNLNVVGTAVLTERLVPLLQSSQAPRIIFMSNELGSITKLQHDAKPFSSSVLPLASSKAAVSMLTMHYALTHPKIRVNACCTNPVLGQNTSQDSADESDPSKWAVDAVKLATEDKTLTGSFVTSEGAIPW